MGPGQDQDDDGVKDQGHREQNWHDRPIDGLHQVRGAEPGAGVDRVTLARPQAITGNISDKQAMRSSCDLLLRKIVMEMKTTS